MASNIRVAIVDDVQESRDNVERLLKFEPDVQVVGKASGGKEAIDLVLSQEPTVVLMDVNMPDIDGIEATKAIVSHRPNTGVIMMSVLNEPDVLRRSMLAGAREYLVKPFSFDELLSSVRMVHETVEKLPTSTSQQATQPASTSGGGTNTQHSGNRARIVTLAGSKGGAGRSFLACNFAVALKDSSKKRVALVDANMSAGDIGVLMNVGESKSVLEAVSYQYQIDSELMENILQEHGTGVKLLLAPSSPQDAEMVTPNILRDCLSAMSSMFDYIIVDTRPGFDDLNLQLFDMSDLILLTVTMEMSAIKDAKQFLEITELLGYDNDRVRVVLNRSNTSSGIPAEEIGDSLRRELWMAISDEPGPALRSVNEGVPLVAGGGNSTVANEIVRMVGKYLHEIEPELATVAASETAPKTSRSLVGRLRGALRS